MFARAAALAATAILTGCLLPTESEPNLADGPVELVLRVGEEEILAGNPVRVGFAQVLEDTRCPIDVECPHAGNAAVQVGIGLGMGPTHPFVLNSDSEPRQAEWNGVRMTLLAVTPEPREGEIIPEGLYAIRLRLEAIP